MSTPKSSQAAHSPPEWPKHRQERIETCIYTQNIDIQKHSNLIAHMTLKAALGKDTSIWVGPNLLPPAKQLVSLWFPVRQPQRGLNRAKLQDPKPLKALPGPPPGAKEIQFGALGCEACGNRCDFASFGSGTDRRLEATLCN